MNPGALPAGATEFSHNFLVLAMENELRIIFDSQGHEQRNRRRQKVQCGPVFFLVVLSPAGLE